MLKSVTSLFKTTSTSTTSTADIKTDITSLNTINTVENSTVTVPKETATNDTPLIHLVRQQRRQKLEETVLIRKIAHQSLTNHYEQDHLPLSHVQEKLKDDEAPLVQVQQQLEQQKNDAVIYTATKEKLKSIFYNQRMSYSFLTKPIQPRHTIPTSSANTSNNSTESISTANNDVDDKDYDVWDDAVIGRIMNLVDTIGVDSTQGTTQETENTSSENPIENVTEKDGSKDNSKEEPMVFMNARENRIESMTEGLINFDEIISDNLKLSSNESAKEKDNTVSNVTIEITLRNKRSDNLLRDSGYGEKATSRVDNNKHGGRLFGKYRSIPSFSSKEISSSQEDNSTKKSNQKSRRNSHLSRKSSIHSRSSRQSSVSSKFSVNTTGVIMEEGDDDPNNPKFRDKFFTTKRSTRKSNKSLHFLRKLWKANHQQNLSSNETIEQYYQQNGDGYQLRENLSDRELNIMKYKQQNNNIQVEKFETNTVETSSRQTSPDYSNFYLAMPNGQWMVRTRTAARKITGTQYVDQERI